MNAKSLQIIEDARKVIEKNVKALAPSARVNISIYEGDADNVVTPAIELGWEKYSGDSCKWHESSNESGQGKTIVFTN